MLAVLTSINIFAFSLLAAFLLTRKLGPPTARYLLVAFFVSWIGNLLEAIGLLSGFFAEYPRLAFWGSSLIWAQGPLLYLFCRAMTMADFRLRWQDLGHFVPAVLVLALTQLSYQNLSSDEQQMVLEASQVSAALPVILATLLFYVYVSTYLFFSWRSIQRYQDRLRREYANLEQYSMQWLFVMLGSFALVLLIAALQNTVRFTMPSFLYLAQVAVFGAGLLFASRLLLHFMAHEPVHFLSVASFGERQNRTDWSEPKGRLQEFMKQEQAYLDPDLSLAGLAERLEMEPRALSTLINQGFAQSFFDYINAQRIAYACERLRSTTAKERNITEIMYESGFNSKSSFNTAFRKYTDMTPSQYRKSG
ncbi:MAG: AraC family transcriptional regulator [Bacteroidota bacterium]